VYDSSGRLVRTLVEQEQESGQHQAEWRGEDNDGSLLASGTYMAILTAGPRRLSRRLTLLR
jgi:flagellar hook assembly protein FlgD